MRINDVHHCGPKHNRALTIGANAIKFLTDEGAGNGVVFLSHRN